MSDALSEWGVDEPSLNWRDLALCEDKESIETNLFYDEYEKSVENARQIDQLCLSCPVMKQCFASGIEGNHWGTWGGIFLTNGRVDMARNAHKTEEVWEEIRNRIGTEHPLQ